MFRIEVTLTDDPCTYVRDADPETVFPEGRELIDTLDMIGIPMGGVQTITITRYMDMPAARRTP